jgi:hypothetical protein
MIRSGIDISIIRLGSIFWILLLTFVLLVFKKADYDKSDYRGQSAPIEISIIKNDATVSTGIQSCHFQKIWIPNKDNFRLLTFDQTKFLDNNKVDQKIFILDKIRKKSTGYLIPLIHYQLFPKESDEIPILS